MESAVETAEQAATAQRDTGHQALCCCKEGSGQHVASTWSGTHHPRPGSRASPMAHTKKAPNSCPSRGPPCVPSGYPRSPTYTYMDMERVKSWCTIRLDRRLVSSNCLSFLSPCPWLTPLACPAWLLKLWCLSPYRTLGLPNTPGSSTLDQQDTGC